MRSNTETTPDFEPRMDLTTSLSVLLSLLFSFLFFSFLSLSLAHSPCPSSCAYTRPAKELSRAFHARFLRSILDRAESTEATERDSIGGILRFPSSYPPALSRHRLCIGASDVAVLREERIALLTGSTFGLTASLSAVERSVLIL